MLNLERGLGNGGCTLALLAFIREQRSSHTHTSAPSFPQLLPPATGSSPRVHSRAPYSLHRASASSHVAAARQPPIPSDALPHAPYVLSKAQPSSAHRSVDFRCHSGDGSGSAGAGGDGGGDGGGGLGAGGGYSALANAASANHAFMRGAMRERSAACNNAKLAPNRHTISTPAVPLCR